MVLRLKALKAGRAAVSICRKGPGGKETLETCSKGIDNDCNGKAGPKDPACWPLLKRLTG